MTLSLYRSMALGIVLPYNDQVVGTPTSLCHEQHRRRVVGGFLLYDSTSLSTSSSFNGLIWPWPAVGSKKQVADVDDGGLLQHVLHR